MTGDLDATSQAIGRLQVSVEKLDLAVERLADRLEDLQRLRWLTLGGLMVLSGLSGAGAGWISKVMHLGG
ncbi:hypothetical protein A8950_2339 [Dongia mobilis]|uniref:Uncharacterized protein n=1 Tax=Dongia mobilis TaxID=578943 RepID=A0A4R6WRQ1_9PROT|nr:hypothetical protein [Dongia mobilis]TDQ82516.1 hypothetical protein A8950_2339 [Dongia mobilis]